MPRTGSTCPAKYDLEHISLPCWNAAAFVDFRATIVQLEKELNRRSHLDGCTHPSGVDFKANPKRVYEALTDPKQFSAFSGFPAEIDGEAGGAFNCFGGQITGQMTELVPDQKIVQTWRPAVWPDGANYMVRFELKAQDGGTRLILDHWDFPEDNREHLDAGWPRMYWEPLKKY
jgi:uncharacterized protein YndB with AHSA1/START domain